jgi:MFS family permease
VYLVSQSRLDEASAAIAALQRLPLKAAQAKVAKLAMDGTKRQPKPSLWSLVSSRVYRFPLLIACFISLLRQFCGMNVVVFFSTETFEMVGIPGFVGSLMMATATILSTALAVSAIDRLGRRVLLLVSTIGMLATSLLLNVALPLIRSSDSASLAGALGVLVIVGAMLFVTSNEFGIGPMSRLISAELFPLRPRGTAMSIGALISWGSAVLVAQGFRLLQSLLGGFCFVPFSV